MSFYKIEVQQYLPGALNLAGLGTPSNDSGGWSGSVSPAAVVGQTYYSFTALYDALKVAFPQDVSAGSLLGYVDSPRAVVWDWVYQDLLSSLDIIDSDPDTYYAVFSDTASQVNHPSWGLGEVVDKKRIAVQPWVKYDESNIGPLWLGTTHTSHTPIYAFYLSLVDEIEEPVEEEEGITSAVRLRSGGLTATVNRNMLLIQSRLAQLIDRTPTEAVGELVIDCNSYDLVDFGPIIAGSPVLKG